MFEIGHLPPIWQTTQVRITRHAGHSWTSKDEHISDVFYGSLHMFVLSVDDDEDYIFWRDY